jgi:hypothetical protein
VYTTVKPAGPRARHSCLASVVRRSVKRGGRIATDRILVLRGSQHVATTEELLTDVRDMVTPEEFCRVLNILLRQRVMKQEAIFVKDEKFPGVKPESDYLLSLLSLR